MPGRNGFGPNSWVGSHKNMVFGINTAGINTRGNFFFVCNLSFWEKKLNPTVYKCPQQASFGFLWLQVRGLVGRLDLPFWGGIRRHLPSRAVLRDGINFSVKDHFLRTGPDLEFSPAHGSEKVFFLNRSCRSIKFVRLFRACAINMNHQCTAQLTIQYSN